MERDNGVMHIQCTEYGAFSMKSLLNDGLDASFITWRDIHWERGHSLQWDTAAYYSNSNL